MVNKDGILLTSNEDTLEEAVTHYKSVFKHRDMEPGVESLKLKRESLCKMRLAKVKKVQTPPWTIEDVIFVLKGLKTGKSEDLYHIPNELFKPETAGDDLILAITKLMNRIKDEMILPLPMNVYNVTNLFKNKGKKTRF